MEHKYTIIDNHCGKIQMKKKMINMKALDMIIIQIKTPKQRFDRL